MLSTIGTDSNESLFLELKEGTEHARQAAPGPVSTSRLRRRVVSQCSVAAAGFIPGSLGFPP